MKMSNRLLHIYRFIDEVFPLSFCLFGICFAFLAHFKPDLNEILSNSFLITYLGVIIGFGLTIFAFIITMTEKIVERINKNLCMPTEKKERLSQKVLAIRQEMEDDIFFCFICLIVSIIISIWSKIDIPFLGMNMINSCLPKSLVLESCKLTILLLSLLGIYDMMKTSFELSTLTTKIE